MIAKLERIMELKKTGAQNSEHIVCGAAMHWGWRRP